MSREELAARLGEAEAELQAAQREHDGSLRAVERYRQARARLRQAERWAVALLSGRNTTSRRDRSRRLVA